MDYNDNFFVELLEGATFEQDGSKLTVIKKEPDDLDTSSIRCVERSAFDAFQGASSSRGVGADFSTVRVYLDMDALRPESRLEKAIKAAICPNNDGDHVADEAISSALEYGEFAPVGSA